MTRDTHVGCRIGLIGTFVVATLTAAAAADPPDATTIVSRMKQAVEPARSSLRKLTLTVAQGGTTSTVVLGQARGKVDGGNRILTVVLAPADLRGTAYLAQEAPASDTDKLWVYVPAIGRVRTVVSSEAFSAFLNSDFAYADLGFVTLHSEYSLKGEDTTNGVRAYRIDAVPSQRWYYSHIITTVAADSYLPVERSFYDAANELWKVERFEKMATIEGVPTELRVSMDDVQAKSRTTLDVTDLRYGAEVPGVLLAPEGLPHAVGSPLWSSLKAPVGE